MIQAKFNPLICCFFSAKGMHPEMLLIKFIADDAQQRTDALQIIEHFNGKTVDLTPNSMVAMITGDSPKVDAAVGMLGQFDIIETVRTGKVVMARGEQAT